MQYTVEHFNHIGKDKLPGHLGIDVMDIGEGSITLSMAIQPYHLAPNGYLHAGTIVTLADTAAGYGCITTLPDNATGFTTIELKCNFISTALAGNLTCIATPQHTGRTTQVWDAQVVNAVNHKTIAHFRCTQLILYPKRA